MPDLVTDGDNLGDHLATRSFKTIKGSDIASATNITIGTSGNTFDVTGTTTIEHFDNANWAVGSVVSLHFDGAVTLTNNAGGLTGAQANILLSGDANFTTATGDILTFLLHDSTNWQEVSRNSVASIPDGSITNAKLDTGIDAVKLADGSVTNSELKYINTLSDNAQSQLDLKSPLASPTFTGVVTIPNVANLETAVVANTAKVGITSGQASTITANTTSIDSINSYAGTELYVSRWKTRTTNNNNWRSVAWSPELSLFAAVSSYGAVDRVMTSPDGITWTNRTASASSTWTGIAWAPSLTLFCAVSYSGTVMTSPDGITWTSRTPASANQWRSVVWSPDLTLFCAVSENGTGNRVMTSPDGITWTSRTNPEDNEWESVTWSPDLTLFCAVSKNGTYQVMTSPDGITWTSRTAAASNRWFGVVWAPELTLFCAVSSNGTLDRAMTSPDGITWTSRTTPTYNDWQSVAWAPELGIFCAVSSDGTGDRVMTSPDGITWTLRISAADNYWHSVIWSPELYIFVAVGESGTGDRVMTTTYSDRLNLKAPKASPTFTGTVTTAGLTSSGTVNLGGNNLDNIKNLHHNISTSGTDIDFSEDQLQTYGALSANTTFTTANIATGKSKTLRMYASGADRIATFPSGIRWVGTAPVSNTFTLTQSKFAIFTFTCFGSTESEILGAYAIEE